MVGGQYMDVAATASHDEELRLLHSLKTGRLIEASVAGAAVLCGVSEPALEPYRAFAREIGLLFQIVDDILDVAGEAADLGKTAGKDARLDKTTYVSRFGLDGARGLAGRESRARLRLPCRARRRRRQPRGRDRLHPLPALVGASAGAARPQPGARRARRAGAQERRARVRPHGRWYTPKPHGPALAYLRPFRPALTDRS